MTEDEIVDFLCRCKKLDLKKIEWILERLRDRLHFLEEFDGFY